MAHVFKDRVLETSTTTGTGTYTLAGAVTGYQAFSAVGNANTCHYCAMEVDANGNPSGGWEVGIGTYTLSGTTLARTDVLTSSNSDAPVNWAAGTRRIFVVHAADTFSDFSESAELTVPIAAGYAPTDEGSLGYDTTQEAWSAGGAGAINGKIPRLLSAQHSTSDTLTASVINTTETAFATTFTIPANYLITGKRLRVVLGFLVTSSASAIGGTIRLRLGGVSGTIMFASNVAAPGSNFAGIGHHLIATLIGTAASGAAANVICVSESYSIWGISRNVTTQPVAVATNASQALTVTATYTGNTAGNSITLASVMVEEWN